MPLKINLLVTGKFPEDKDSTHLKESLYRFWHHFVNNSSYDCKIFYHTWNDPEMKKLLATKYHVGIKTSKHPPLTHAEKYTVYTPQPKAYYPYIDVPRFNKSLAWKEQIRARNAQNVGLRKNNYWYRNFQIMSTLEAIKNSEHTKPDLYIRVRWDTVLSYNFDFDKFINMCYHEQKVIGFGLHPPPYEDNNYDLWSFWHSNTKRLEIGDYYIETSDTWTDQRVQDIVLMFRPSDFNVKVVQNWFDNKLLLAAEWGWWQVLCYNGSNPPTPHVCLNGGATFWRHLIGANPRPPK